MSYNFYNILCFIVIFTCSLIFAVVNSKVIQVGPDRWNDSTDYVSWAQQNNFTVGDVLDFSYSPGSHNVLEVTKATFLSCNASTGVNAKYESGNDQIVLKQAKQYWFICTVDDHCTFGMKLAINVTQPQTATKINQTSIFAPSGQPSSKENSGPRTVIRSKMFFVLAGILSILTIVG